jgi:hypothetical protein
MAWLALALGAVSFAAYVAWLYEQPRGNFEFAYAPFAPEPILYSPMRGFTYEQFWGHLFRLLLLAPALLLMSFGLIRLRPLALSLSSRRLVLFASAASLLLTAGVMLGVLRGRALVDDELVYRMQATFLSEGRIAGHDIGVTPPDVFSVPTRLGYTGKYLPGEALLQIPGLLLGIPALLHLPLLALTLYAWHRALLLRAGPGVAAGSTVALALSPMVMFTSATGHTQPTSLCAIALAGLGYESARARRFLFGACLAGAAIGFGMLTRPQALVPVGGVLSAALGWFLIREKRWGSLAAFGAILGTGLLLVGGYNALLSGSPLRLPWYLQCMIEHYGFGQVWKHDTYTHTLTTALQNLLVVSVRLNAWWLGFPCSLAVILVWWRLGRPLHGAGIWLGVGAAVLAFEFLYFSTGIAETGPIYHYELILPLSLIAGSAAHAALARWKSAAVTAIVVHVALGTSSWVVEQALRVERLMTAIHAESDAILARIPPRALLFHELRASESRPMGWVFDNFPKRFRGQRDDIVTFPSLPRPFRARVAAAYPGRSCWYFRRNPGTEGTELYRCEDARALMDRALEDDQGAPLWVRSTAYRHTSYDPNGANRRRRALDSTGKPVITCCGLRALEKLGTLIPEASKARCVEDGP